MIRRLGYRLLLAASAAAVASSPAAAMPRSFPVAGFDRVDLAAAAGVEVRTGQPFGMRADGDPESLDALAPVVRNGTLVIGWKPGVHRIHQHDKLRVWVLVPRLAGASLSGAGQIVVDRVETPAFSADVSGSGELRLPALRTAHASLEMSGAGSIVAAGSAGRIDGHVSGVGSIDASGLASRSGDLAMSGTGHVTARVDGPVAVSLSGIGEVSVLGNARCIVHRSGLGSVHCPG